MADTPLLVDAAGSGLYEKPDGSRYFRENEHPEDRWIRNMTEDGANDHELEQAIEESREEERARWCAEDDEAPWRTHEKPRGLMYGLPDQHQEAE